MSGKPRMRVRNLLGEPVSVEWGSVRYELKANETKVFEGDVARQFMRRCRFKKVAGANGSEETIERLEIEEVTTETELVEKSTILEYQGKQVRSQEELNELIEAEVLRRTKAQGAGDEPDEKQPRNRGGRPRKDAEKDPDKADTDSNGDAS